MIECVGLTFQILFRNYEEAMLRVKDIFISLIANKFWDLDEEYYDEITYFYDIFE